jgi:hypothetical protein
MGSRRALATAALAITASVFAVGAAELAVRGIFHDVTTTSPIDTWFGLRWKREHLRWNSRHYREREFARRKPAETYRVAVIGDSFTIAMGVGEEERFTGLLQGALEDGGGNFEVLNFGIAGAETPRQVVALDDDVLPIDPDFVLLQWYPNDFEFSKPKNRPYPSNLISSRETHSRLLRFSALYALANHGWHVLQIRMGWVERFEDYMLERFGNPEGIDSRTALFQLRTFVAHCQRAGVPVGIALMPRTTPRLREYPLAFLHERVLGLCREMEIPCLDLTPVFVPYTERLDEIWLNRFDRHLGPFGHQRVAHAILERFGDPWHRGEATTRSGLTSPLEGRHRSNLQQEQRTNTR